MKKSSLHTWSIVNVPVLKRLVSMILWSRLEYGRKTLLDLEDSSILDIQKQLLKGFDKIVEGKSPYEFSKVKGREVDWLTALEVTRDFMDGNDSIIQGNNRLNTMNNSMRRETGRNSRLPKRMDTIVNAFCDNLGKKGTLRMEREFF